MRTFTSASILILLVGFVAPLPICEAADVLNIAGQRQLLIDGRFFQDARGAVLAVHPAAKTGDRTLQADRPWEGGVGSYCSVLKDGDTYHLWYKTGSIICYARSSDGIRWEKPALGLTEYEGSRENNIVIGHGAGGVDNGGHGPQVFVDPVAPAERRFRLITRQSPPGEFVDMYSSPDGIRWTLTHKDILRYSPPGKPHHLDSQNVIFWDDRIGKYVAYMRRNLATEGTQGRAIARSESKTLDGFEEVQAARIVMTRDKNDLIMGGIDMIDHYTSAAIKYPWAQDVYFMFPAVYFHYVAGRQSEWPERAPINAGPLHTRFAAGRDGIHWEQYDRRPFVDLGLAGEFDSKGARVFYGLVPSLDGTRIYIYFVGTDKLHGWGREGSDNDELLSKAGLAPSGTPTTISRAVIRMDGFVSARFDYTGGEFTTPPLTFEGNRLVVNLDTSATGVGRIALLDPSGDELDGFGAADCDLLHTCNEINRTVSWKGNRDVGRLAGKPVRLRFSMRDCDLYAFQFVR